MKVVKKQGQPKPPVKKVPTIKAGAGSEPAKTIKQFKSNYDEAVKARSSGHAAYGGDAYAAKVGKARADQDVRDGKITAKPKGHFNSTTGKYERSDLEMQKRLDKAANEKFRKDAAEQQRLLNKKARM
jgi:hypothetical protein